jgi:hypothetical protein
MVLEFVGKIFDFIIGGPPRACDLRPPLVRDDSEQEAEHDESQVTADLVDKARPMDNIPRQRSELEGINHKNKPELFQWILLLLRLVTTVSFGFPAWKPEPDKANSVSRFHTQSYGYLDALTTLLLRRDEIVAAVESSPGSGVILSDDKSTNPQAEVRWLLLAPSLSTYPTFQSEDPDSVDSDFYDTKYPLPSSVQVTGIANPERGYPHGTKCNQVKVLDSTKSLWEDLKKNPYHYLTITPETRCTSIF